MKQNNMCQQLFKKKSANEKGRKKSGENNEY